MTRTGARRRAPVAVLVLFELVGASCGTRVTAKGPIDAISPPAGHVKGASPAGRAGSPAPVAAPPVPRPVASATPPSAVDRPVLVPTRRAPEPSSPALAQPGRAASSGVDDAATAEPNRSATTEPPEANGQRSPVAIATVGTYSGPVGGTLFPSVQGLQVWIKHINGRGGVAGHEVRLLIFDDGGDPARSRAAAQEAVERHHVVAFVQNTGAVTGHATTDYITARRIPVIGSDGQTAGNYTSPMYFPQMSSADEMLRATVAGMGLQLVPEGKTKLAIVSCTEAQNCKHADQFLAEAAPTFGFEVVARITASLAQPDFTAECLSARNAGAQAFVLVMDSSTVARMASSCARQGFHPVFSAPGAVIADRFKDDPNLDGLVAASLVFPWFQTGTPATDEYRQAMTAYGRGVPAGPSPATGWVSGKLFERAARRSGEPPSSEGLLRALWSMENDDLGGLTQPLTYQAGQPARPIACWFNLRVKNGTWTSPDNYQRLCWG